MRVLVGKELREFRASPAALVPIVLVGLVCVALPFIVIVLVPALTGDALGEDRLMQETIELAMPRMPELAGFPRDVAVEAFLYQQFLLAFLIAPIAGAATLAAHSVVGEKQGRTLEPLLTTPITTAELLVAKVMAAFLPSLVVEIGGLACYFGLMAIFAPPGVLASILGARTMILVALVGPIAALVALQMTIAVSSRANDARSAQQITVIVVLPLMGLLIGQVVGAFIIPTFVLLLAAFVLAAVWGLLVLFSVALFERETILTRWK
jgi:ABC-2 type transport system permease protein